MPNPDPNVVALTALAQQIQAATDAQDAQIAQLTSALSDETAKENADQALIAQLQAEIVKLTPAPPPPPPPDPITAFVPQVSFLGLEKAAWTLAGGTAANTGQKGSTGTATAVLDANGVLQGTVKPAGPYYDCYMMHHVAGAGTTVPFPKFKKMRARYGVTYIPADAATIAKIQALEKDNSIYDGTYRYHGAGQLAHGFFRYYDPSVPNWIATKVAVSLVPGQPIRMVTLCEHDAVAHTTLYIGVAINGVYYPLGITVKNTAKAVSSPWVEATWQLDSNSKGESFTCGLKQIDLEWTVLA